MKQKTVLATFLIIIGAWAIPGQLFADDESFVIGRLTGTYQPLPGFFKNDLELQMKGIESVEFGGFRLLRVEDGKRFLIRPNKRGFFFQDLPGGEYTLTRRRTDRPDYKAPKSIDILKFMVQPETLVNIGTINIDLDSDPYESLDLGVNSAKGKYYYSYRYERKSGENTFDDPLSWFVRVKPKAAAEFTNSVYEVYTTPVPNKDGSVVILRTNINH